MGFDIRGHAPTSADGEYLRCSVWQWPALVSLIRDLCPEESHDCSGWLANEGRGLNAVDATRLAKRLLSLEAEGLIEAYCRDQKAKADTALDLLSERHPELNVRVLEEGVTIHPGEDFDRKTAGFRAVLEETWRALVTPVDVAEFACFAAASGGFSIW
jgi:hypothetical protein